MGAAPLLPAATASQEQPFAWADFTWMNGQSKQRTFILPSSPHVQLSLYLDTYYAFSAQPPRDNTLVASASIGRSNELQLNLASVGLEFNYGQVIGRLNLQYGGMLGIVQDLDASVGRGRDLSAANLKYVREATLGYHFDVLAGINLEAGIFMSYIGLESYLLAENWTYHRSIVCDHTPFYFQGIRGQIYLTPRLKLEPWLMNGWQSYGKFNSLPAVGMAMRYSPTGSFSLVGNFYFGQDTPTVSARLRFHHDHSLLWRAYQRADASGLSTLAFSLNNHFGFETGGAGLPGMRRAHMLGTSLVGRAAFLRDLWALALRLEFMSNPSRYLAQFPPPDLANRPGQDLNVYGLTATASLMPRDFFELRAEVVYRRSSVPYFAGSAGTTSSTGLAPVASGAGLPAAVSRELLAILSANFRL